jgi:putative spermidine/putrescine transport system permease protein
MSTPIAQRARPPSEIRREYALRLWLIFLFVFLVGPIAITVRVSLTNDTSMTFPPSGLSLRWYKQILQDAVWRDSFIDTVIIGLTCSAVATTIGTLSAYGISRVRNAFFRNALLVLFLSPLVVPYVSYGMAVYPFFAFYRLVGTHLGVGIAQGIVSIPFVVLAVFSSVRKRDQILESAARTVGASPMQAFFHVAMPLLAPGIAAGAVLAFMTSFDDVIMPMFLGGSTVTTVPKAMMDALSMSSDPSVMAASSVVSLTGLVGYLLLKVLQVQRKSRTSLKKR